MKDLCLPKEEEEEEMFAFVFSILWVLVPVNLLSSEILTFSN